MLATRMRMSTTEADVGGGGGFAGSFQEADVQLPDQTTYTTSSVSFGAAESDRHIYAAIWGKRAGSGLSISSVTIGGVSATQLVSRANSAGNTSVVAIWGANVPSGTSGDVVVTFSTTLVRYYAGFYRIVGASSALTPNDSDSDTANGSVTASIDIPSGDSFVIAVGSNDNGDNDEAWTGATEDDHDNTSAFLSSSVASISLSSSETGRSITRTGDTAALVAAVSIN